MDQALQPREAMLGMTLWAALASRMDTLVGSLEVGKRADLVVTDRDWLKLSDPHGVLSAQILKTFIDGEQVHPPATYD